VNLTQLAETYCGGAVERQVASAMLDLIESHVERNLTTRRFLDREHREYEVVGKI
jgi:hypothetical protein